MSVNKQKVLIESRRYTSTTTSSPKQSPLIARLEIFITQITAHTMGSQWLPLRCPAQTGQLATTGASWVPTRDQTVAEHRRQVGAPRTVPREAPTEATSRAGRAGNLCFRSFFQQRNLTTNLQSSGMH